MVIFVIHHSPKICLSENLNWNADFTIFVPFQVRIEVSRYIQVYIYFVPEIIIILNEQIL